LERIFRLGSAAVYVAATVALMAMSLSFIGVALYEVVRLAFAREPVTMAMLDSVGLVIISLAVFDLAKFLFEEEILRDRELRSIRETRRTLTKFITIITIATSLEALVFIFKTGRQDIDKLIYPTVLMAVVVLLICGLAVYQRISSDAERVDPSNDQD
jgi:hypothetical protein